MLREDTAAVTVLSSLVQMPQEEHGPRQAIEHWRGSWSTPLGQNLRTGQPGLSCSERRRKMQDSNRRKDGAGSSRQIEGLPVVRHKVAGIDLGSERHWVSAPTVEGS